MGVLFELIKRFTRGGGLLFLVTIILAHGVTLPAVGKQLPPGLAPYIVVDAANDKVLYRNNAYLRWAPASLTKLMTAYTVFRAIKPDHLEMNSPVRISETALSQPPSKMGLPIGTIMTIESALKIIMVKSANDVSVALGEAVAGSEAEFTSMMNEHAKRLGMTDSNFVNTHGLHDPEQYTTARDMAILALAVGREFPQYAGFFDIPALRVVGRRLRNHNALLRLFEGTDGMKTGYVCASGYNVIVRTKRKGRKLVAVVMGHTSGLKRSVAAAELLTGGFQTDARDIELTLDTLAKPDWVSDEPEDVTRYVCPRKFRNQRYLRNKNKKKKLASQKMFKSADGTSVVDPDQKLSSSPVELPIPTKRPFKKFVAAASAAVSLIPEKAPRDTQQQGSTDQPLTLRQKAKLYLKPRSDLRADVRVHLGGGIGPNPFGLKHTNGGVYKSQIPVPQQLPTLDN